MSQIHLQRRRDCIRVIKTSVANIAFSRACNLLEVICAREDEIPPIIWPHEHDDMATFRFDVSCDEDEDRLMYAVEDRHHLVFMSHKRD